MAKTLAIKVQFESTGEEKVIKNIDELEKAIEDLSEEIKTLDFGSEEYDKAAGNLAKLKAGLRDVDKEIEGLDTEQRLSALAGATELVAGSFLIASSAARTFGASAESIEEVEKLEAQALEAVNIALGVRAVAEGLVQAQQLKRLAADVASNVQTKIATGLQAAYTAVVGTSTGALKAFRLALASTGIGLIVVALGALIANWDKLTKSIGGASDAQDAFNDINEEAQKSIAKTSVELDFYGGIVNDVSKSEEERVQALEKLNELGVITEDITLDQADALETLNERLELARENILLKAQAEAAASLLSQAFEAQITAQNSSLEDNLTFFDQLINSFTSFGNSYVFLQQNATDALENQQDAIETTGAEVTKFQEIYLSILEKLNQSEAKLSKTREESDKKTKTRNKTKEERNKLDEDYTKILNDIARSTEKARKQIELLTVAERDEVAVIEGANKILEKQNELLEERLGILGTTQGETEDFADSLDRLLRPDQVPDSIIELRDIFNDLFTTINEEGGMISGAVVDDGVTTIIAEANTEAEKLALLLEKLDQVDPSLLDEEQRQILIDFYDNQVRIDDIQKDFNKKLDEEIVKLSEAQGILTEQLANEEITFEVYTEQLKELQKQLDLRNDLYSREVDFNLLLKDILRLQDTAVDRGLSTIAQQEEINNLVANRLFGVESVNDLQEDQLALVEQTTTALLDQTKVYDQVKTVNEQLLALNVKINENLTEQNQKLSDAQFGQLQEFVKANKDKIGEIKKFFETATEENTNLTEEQIDSINTLIDGIETENLAGKINDIASQVVGIFNDITGQIQGIISDSISLQLESLDYYTEQALAQVGDETEKQRAIQEEIRQKAEKERFELNKKARLTDLQFSLASTVANGAQAAINAIATVPPPGGQILAGIYGILTAAQLAIINDQIGFVKSTQFQARRGGLIMGESHEYGGVIARNGLELEGGEAIINRNAVSQFGDLLSQINLSTGGRALTGNDSDIAQEIRQQNQRPIKTYVLYDDIQNTNKINNKLEQISRL